MSCEEAVGEGMNALPSTKNGLVAYKALSLLFPGNSRVPRSMFLFFLFPPFPRYYSIGYENFQYQGPADIFLSVGEYLNSSGPFNEIHVA
jgi:hypothetical protein